MLSHRGLGFQDIEGFKTLNWSYQLDTSGILPTDNTEWSYTAQAPEEVMNLVPKHLMLDNL